MAMIPNPLGIDPDVQARVDIKQKINKILDTVQTTLTEKSGDYGNAWQHPAMFGEMSALDSLWSRLSDKVTRLKSLTAGRKPTYESVEDTLLDIMGYSTLIMVTMELEKEDIERNGDNGDGIN